jgi:hypothetical protein
MPGKREGASLALQGILALEVGRFSQSCSEQRPQVIQVQARSAAACRSSWRFVASWLNLGTRELSSRMARSDIKNAFLAAVDAIAQTENIVRVVLGPAVTMDQPNTKTGAGFDAGRFQ